MAYKLFFVLTFRLQLAMPRIESGRAHERGRAFICITVTQNEPYVYASVVIGRIRKIA